MSERERGRDSKDRQNWRLLDCAQYFEKVRAHSVSIPIGVRRFPIVGGKDAHTKTGTSLATVRLRVRTLRELLPITSITLKTTRSIFVIDHSKQSLCNEQDTRQWPTVISLALHACALALHSKACVGVTMALPLDTYHFLCGT